MIKQKFFSRYKAPKLFFLSMALLCWSMTLFQSAAKQIQTEKSVPAFQNETLPLSESIPAFQTDILSPSNTITAFQTKKSQTLELSSVPELLTSKTASTCCQSLAKQIDSDVISLFSHSGSDYSDYYLYSPLLEKQFQISPLSASGSNLQIVFVWNKDGSCRHIYLGMPCIEYNF